ncbi:MAG: hypothetical protein KatS3mg117_2011 [Geminicoccaceae bacterium]|nr:MAG: hypothetical protein KatS3mg117_2011 [Geminicoccaceae bacterium]
MHYRRLLLAYRGLTLLLVAATLAFAFRPPLP